METLVKLLSSFLPYFLFTSNRFSLQPRCSMKHEQLLQQLQ